MCCGCAIATSKLNRHTAAPAAAPTPAATTIDLTQLAALVKQQFGDTFTLPAKFPTPLITADFDGDGVQDIAIVANSKDPLPDSYAFKYECPILTTLISALAIPSSCPLLALILNARIICWSSLATEKRLARRNAQSKICHDESSIRFNSTVGRMLISKKKPPVFVIKAIESQVMDSAVCWEAKKKRWRWEPGDRTLTIWHSSTCAIYFR